MISGYVMTDSNIETAVAAWFADATAAESTYGHISTWDTSGVTDMEKLFCGRQDWMDSESHYDGKCFLSTSFNEDISAWDTSSATDMYDVHGHLFQSGHRRLERRQRHWDGRDVPSSLGL